MSAEPPVGLRPLGSTGLLASPLTLGTSGLGKATAPGTPAEDDAVQLAGAMLHGPYALVDTSNAYAGGRSEQVLGLAVERGGVAPGRSVVTKVDRDPSTGVFGRDRVLRSFDESLQRLGVDRVELLHLHDPYTVSFAEAMAPGGAVAGLVELRAAGRVGAIGIAAGRVSVVYPYVDSEIFDAVLTHNRFTLVDRSALGLIERARAIGMGVLNAAPFGGGLLARGAASGARYAYNESPPELLAWVADLEQLCVRYGIDLPTAALQFSLRSPLVDSTVVGISSAARVAELERMRTTAVPEGFWQAVDDLGAAPSPVVD